MESIRLWLNGDRNYVAGVKLYLQFGTDKMLKRLFSSEECTDFKKKRLTAVLEELISEKKQVEVKAVIAKEKLIEKHQAERVLGNGWSAEMDELEKALYNKWKPIFLKMMDLTSRLDPVARAGVTDDGMRIQAGVMALQILDLDDECDEIYDQRDHYQQYGKLPVQKSYGELCIDPKLIPMKLANHRRYAREFRSRLLKNPNDVDAAEQLKKHEWFIEQYLKMLNQ